MNPRHERTIERLTAARNHLELIRRDLRELHDFLPEAKYPAMVLYNIAELRDQLAEAEAELHDADYAAECVAREIRGYYRMESK